MIHVRGPRRLWGSRPALALLRDGLARLRAQGQPTAPPPLSLRLGVREAGRLGHRVHAPVQAVRRPGMQRHLTTCWTNAGRTGALPGMQRHLHDLLDPAAGGTGAWPGWSAGPFAQACNAACPIALPPEPHRRLAGLQAACHRDRPEPVGTQEHDPRPSHELRRRVAVFTSFSSRWRSSGVRSRGKAIDAEQDIHAS